MRRIITIFLILSLLASLTACRKKGTHEGSDSVDYIAMIREELLPEDTTLSKKIAAVTKLTLDNVDGATLNVTVSAPMISDALLSWFETIPEEEYTEEGLENKILELLENDKETVQFQLNVADGTIQYTDEFRNKVSCGLREFYTKLSYMLLEEMEADANE